GCLARGSRGPVHQNGERRRTGILGHDRIDQETLPVTRRSNGISPAKTNANVEQPLGDAGGKTGALDPYRRRHEPGSLLHVKNFLAVSGPVRIASGASRRNLPSAARRGEVLYVHLIPLGHIGNI